MEEGPGPGFDERLQALIQAGRDRWVASARRILKDGAEAEDVVQDTLGRVWERLRENPPENIEAYLARAVYVNALKRRARRRRHLSLEAHPELALARVAEKDEDDEPERIDPLTLERALEGLPETQQAVIRLKYYVGLSFREIGQTLEISGHTAASRCRYALESLRKVLRRGR